MKLLYPGVQRFPNPVQRAGVGRFQRLELFCEGGELILLKLPLVGEGIRETFSEGFLAFRQILSQPRDILCHFLSETPCSPSGLFPALPKILFH